MTEDTKEIKLSINNNSFMDNASIVYSDLGIVEGDYSSHPKKIDIEIQDKALHIIQDRITPIRSAFILINEDDQAFIASSMGDDMKRLFFTKVRSLIDDNEPKVPLFYKSSELKNIKVMSEEDYCKQSASEVIHNIHFVDIDDTCNQIIEETNMKHLILILELHRGQDYVITSNTLEKDFAIALTKAKLTNERYTRIVLTEEIDAIYKDCMQKEIQVFEIPEREYPLSKQQKLWYKNNPSQNPRKLKFYGWFNDYEGSNWLFYNETEKLNQNHENSNIGIYSNDGDFDLLYDTLCADIKKIVEQAAQTATIMKEAVKSEMQEGKDLKDALIEARHKYYTKIKQKRVVGNFCTIGMSIAIGLFIVKFIVKIIGFLFF